MSLSDDSPTYSPSDTASFSEVPTEPLADSERQLMADYMHRRQHFLSDYERYSPVQNMHMLANHVFDLSENIFRMKSEISNNFTSSRRMLDMVVQNQREENDSMRDMGDDLGSLKQDVSSLKQEMDQMRRETQEGISELKQMISMLVSVRG